VNLWIKRAIGAAALGGGLLALSAGAAGAQEVSADVSARLGRQTSAEVRVCADGRVLSRLLGSCGQAASGGTRVTVDAGRDRDGTGVRARARVPRLAAADVSVGTRRSRPAAASGQASTPRAQADATAAAGASPGASADATARLSRLRDGRLLDLDGELSLAGVGLLGSSPFTLAGDPATDSLLPTGELTLGDLTGEAPAGIGVLETGPIASGNQVGVDVGDVSPSVPVTVCGNAVGVLGDTSAACAPAQGSTGGGSTGGGSTGGGSIGGGGSAGGGGSSSSAALASLGRIKLSGSKVVVPVFCASAARGACKGSLTIRAKSGKGKRAKRITIGSARFSGIARGTTRRVGVKLNRSGRKLLRKGKVKATVAMKVRAGAAAQNVTRSATLRKPKKRNVR
jgi:hypothetical protein